MYLTMLALIDKARVKYPGCKLILNGDLVDRGPRSKEVVEYAMKNCIPTVLGNHEDLLLAYSEHTKMGYKAKCARYYDRDVWLQNGGGTALHSWGARIIPKDVLDWMSDLPPYIIIGEMSDGRKLLVSHTGYGLDADKGNWMAALWGRHGYDMFSFAHNEKGEPIDDGYFRIIGHTRVKAPIITDTYAKIDGGAAYVEQGYGDMIAFIWPSKETIVQRFLD